MAGWLHNGADLPGRRKLAYAGAACGVLLLIAGGVYVQHQNTDRQKAVKSAAIQREAAKARAQNVQGDHQKPADKLSPASGTAAPAQKQPAVVPEVAANGMAIGLYSGSVTPGSSFTVRVYENSGSIPVNAVQIELKYDPAKLEAVAVEQAGQFNVGAATDLKTPGVVRFARAVSGSPPLKGMQPAAGISFKVRAGVTGAVTLQPESTASLIVRAAGATNILKSFPPVTFTVNPS